MSQKKKKLNKTKLVKELARNRIGQPKPTKVAKNKKKEVEELYEWYASKYLSIPLFY